MFWVAVSPPVLPRFTLRDEGESVIVRLGMLIAPSLF